MCVCTLFIGHLEYVHKCFFATYILHWAMGIGSHCPCLHCALFMVAMCIVEMVVGIVCTVEFCIVHCPLCNVGAFGVGTANVILQNTTLAMEAIDLDMYIDLDNTGQQRKNKG